MTQEEKDLLLKDLCARLPYGVICNTSKGNGHLCSINQTIFGIEYGINIKATKRDYFNDREEIIKPYLFSPSSMTEEQKKEYKSLCIKNTSECTDLYSIIFPKDYYDTIESIDYLYKNHIDIRNLIPMGLAVDVSGLNIY